MTPELTPAALSDIHAEAFDRSWSRDAFAALLAGPGVQVLGDDDGFVLIRLVADEAEILTLAVRPRARRRGLGLTLTRAGAEAVRRLGAVRLHLEVAEDNTPARRLYEKAGFAATGFRPGYYARTGGAVAAHILTLELSETLPTVTG